MSVIDRALKSNEQYARAYDPKLGAGPPRPAIAVVTAWIPDFPTSREYWV
jgi:hypothetical protein